jgi:hypothetical protein
LLLLFFGILGSQIRNFLLQLAAAGEIVNVIERDSGFSEAALAPVEKGNRATTT